MQTGSRSTGTVTEKLRRLELISELFDICNSTTRLNELMDKVFKKVVNDVGAEAGSLWLIDDARTEIACHVAEGPTRDKVVGLKLPKGTGVVGFVIDNAECQTVFDTARDARFANSVDQKTGFNTRSMICAPLIVENQAMGAVQLLNKKGADGRFNEEDLNLLRMLCQSSATPIVNARLRASEQKVHELSALLDISKEVTGTLDLDGCMLTVVNLCSRLISYDRAVIALVGSRGIQISAVSGQPAVNRDDPDIIRLRDMLDGVIKKGQDVYIPSAKTYLKGDPREAHLEEYLHRYRCGSIAVYRLFDEESDVGLFMMESKKENLITGSQLERVGILRNMMTVALRNAQLYDAVPSLAPWGRFRFLRNIPRRIAVSGAVAVAAAAAVLSLMKIDFTVNGTFEAMPRQKYVLYAAVDQAVVSRVVADPARPTGRGDTLLLFNTDEITQGILRERNTAAMLQQAMSTLNQQGDYGQLNTKALELKQARLTLASLERKLVESTVTAPVAGRFSSNDLQNFTGRKFNRGDQLVEIIPDGDGTLRLLVPEKHVNRVVAGQECRFRVPAYPGVTMRGVVRQVTYDTEGENGSVTFPVIVDVAGAGRPLLPGMSGKGKITVGSRSIMAALLDRPISFLAEKLWL